MNVENQIKEVLATLDVLDVCVDEIDVNDDLEQHGMNSMRWVEVLVALERRFDIRFDEAYLMGNKSNAIKTLAKHINTIVEGE